MFQNYKLLGKFKEGFTLIELLVVISIIGLLAVGVVLSFQHQRAKTRDTKRLADLNEIKTALALYHASTGSYPITGGEVITESSIVLGLAPEGDVAYKCLSDAEGGFEESCSSEAKIFMENVPSDPQADDHYYSYQSNEDGSNYGIDFALEVGVESVAEGNNCLGPDGFAEGFCSF